MSLQRGSCWGIWLILVVLLGISSGAVYKGSMTYPGNWMFLDKFCFSNQFGGYGNIYYNFETTNKNLKILLYLDIEEDTNSSGSWKYAYSRRNSLSCDELVAATRGGLKSGVGNITSNVPSKIETFQAMKAYYWYIAIADCTSDVLVLQNYEVHFVNPGGLWQNEVSFDEQGVPELYVSLTLFYAIVYALHLYAVRTLIRMEAWHPIVRILTLALSFEFISSLSEMMHYSIYIHNGIGAPALRGLGELLTMGSQLSIMLLCILISKGWAITTSLLTDRNVILVSMVLLLVAYLTLFIWDTVAKDPLSTAYFYTTIPGIIVLVLRVLLACWFLWCLKVTLGFESLPSKRFFYQVFGLCYTCWFLLLPFVVCLSLAFDSSVRFKIVRSLSSSIDAMAYTAFLVLLWPTRAATYFNIKSAPSLLETDVKKVYGSDTYL